MEAAVNDFTVNLAIVVIVVALALMMVGGEDDE
jgi:hypothetical protein|nr:MAG TPA: hypothetical protein [Caudoviricetes sp.]